MVAQVCKNFAYALGRILHVKSKKQV